MRVSVGWACVSENGGAVQRDPRKWRHGRGKMTGKKLYNSQDVALRNCSKGQVVREAFVEI